MAPSHPCNNPPSTLHLSTGCPLDLNSADQASEHLLYPQLLRVRMVRRDKREALLREDSRMLLLVRRMDEHR